MVLYKREGYVVMNVIVYVKYFIYMLNWYPCEIKHTYTVSRNYIAL